MKKNSETVLILKLGIRKMTFIVWRIANPNNLRHKHIRSKRLKKVKQCNIILFDVVECRKGNEFFCPSTLIISHDWFV